MGYLGYKPADKPLTSADITDSIITSAKIVDGTIANADINSSAAIALSKLSTTGTASSSNYLRGDGAWSSISSGILQVKQAVQSTVVSTTSTSFVDISGLSVSITPASSSNKILVIADIVFSGTGNGWIVGARIARGGTGIYVGDTDGTRIFSLMGGITSNFGSTYDSHIFNRTGVFLDNPASTSSLTYTVQGNVPRGNTTFYLNRDADDTSGGPNHPRTASSITVIEIASSILT